MNPQDQRESQPSQSSQSSPDSSRPVRQRLGHVTQIPFDILIYDTKGGLLFPHQPRVISEYCVTYDRKIQLGRMLAKNFYEKYLNMPAHTFGLDLNEGYDTFDPKEGNENLTMLLEWIRKMSPDGGRLRKVVHESDFVCWRGLLTKLTVAIYDKEVSWKFKAVKRKGVIFLCEEMTDQAKDKEERQSDMDKRMSYWGHKFEQYVTKGDDEEEPDTSRPVTTKEEFAVVCTNDLYTDSRRNPDKKTISILYSGEVDCIGRYGDLLELKTNKGLLGHGFSKSAKSLKWYVQSTFVNARYIVVGHRTPDGIIEQVSAVPTPELQTRGTWRLTSCLEFLSTVLTYVYNCLDNDDEACVVEYKSEIGVHNGIHMRRISPDECDYVPESFLQHYH